MATIASRVTTLETEMRTLKTRVTTLESHVTSLLSRVSAIEADLEPTPIPDPDPLPDPEPEPEPDPTPDPVPTGWPDASNTGAKGTLTTSGGITTNAHGQVIENKSVTGQIIVKHNNVIIRNCKVTENNDVCIYVEGDDCLIEDCTLYGGTGGGARGIWFEGTSQTGANRGKVLRCNISGYEDGIVLGTGSYHVIKDNYFHHPIDFRVSGDPHIDGIQLHGGSGNYSTIEHNNIDGYPEVSSSLTMGNRTAGQGAIGVIVNNNRMIGGTSILYLEGSDSRDCRITNNRMARSIFNNYFSGTGIDTAFYSNNVDDITGVLIR